MSHRSFLLTVALILAIGSAMRLAWLRADPPVTGGVGIVWHDEGAWTHNARNRVLWGVWRTDNWNPVFIAPVFTALEYAAFEVAGVGTWQARIVPALSGLAAVALLMAGLASVSRRRVALVGGLLLATNYAFVMWNRAALMESTMTAAMVGGWCAYCLSERRPRWGLVAGIAAAVAWFTKASAAFFVAAIVLDALVAISGWLTRGDDDRTATARRAGLYVLAGLGISFALGAVFFVLPNWSEYRFYNWEMSVTRKPEYSWRALADRASWLPFAPSLFTRMWVELLAASLGLLAIASRWRQARPHERLLALWIVAGLAELVIHDSGNERRYVMFIPAVVALASLFFGHATLGLTRASRASGVATNRSVTTTVLVLGLSLLLGYLVVGSAVRPVVLDEILAGHLSTAVRLSALMAAILTGLLFLWRARVIGWLAAPEMNALTTVALALVALAVQTGQWAYWTTHRTSYNYEAAVALGRLLPEGTLVQGKLANGLMLESRIRPLFVGNGFGNYADRLARDDVRYILTYDLPRIGYESSDGSGLIQGILDKYPRRRIVRTFTVDETTGPDRAALIDKFPDDVPAHARD